MRVYRMYDDAGNVIGEYSDEREFLQAWIDRYGDPLAPDFQPLDHFADYEPGEPDPPHLAHRSEE